MHVGSFGNRKFAISPISEPQVRKKSSGSKDIGSALFVVSVRGARKFGEYLSDFDRQLRRHVKRSNAGNKLSFR
jgi:hypothetical protein